MLSVSNLLASDTKLDGSITIRPETLANRLSAALSGQHAVTLANPQSEVTSYRGVANEFIADMIQVARGAEGIDDLTRFAVSIVLQEVVKQTDGPENFRNQFSIVVDNIVGGTWSSLEALRIAGAAIPEPDAELRGGLLTLLETFVAAKLFLISQALSALLSEEERPEEDR